MGLYPSEILVLIFDAVMLVEAVADCVSVD